MKQIWAPWRSKYIKKAGKECGCIFCKKAKGKKDKENFVLLRGNYCFALLNLYPYNNGHIMVAPYRHVPDLVQLNKKELLEMFQVIKEMEVKIREKLKPDGFNIGINIGKSAGAGFDEHVHIHLVPRWPGDTNFMSVISDTKVVSQSLKEVYKILKR